jgi:flagellar biosynthesis protein FlhB
LRDVRWQAGKRLGLVVALAVALVWALVAVLPASARGLASGPAGALAVAAASARSLGGVLALLLAGFAVADLLHARFALVRSLRTTRREALRERREEEGDERWRAERRQLHHQLALRAAALQRLRADCVIAGPARLAVALLRERPDQVPRIVTSGTGLLGARLCAVARAAGIPIVAAPRLARALAGLTVDDEIPVALDEELARLYALAQSSWRSRS